MQQASFNIQKAFEKIQAGNRKAFNGLFQAKYTSLLLFAKNYLSDTGCAEEVVSDVFVAIWINRDSLTSIENPETYLYIAVKNRCLNALRGITKTISMDDYPVTQKPTDENPLSEMEHKELAQKLHAVVNALPQQQRTIFRMIKENGLTAKQTAEILQLSPRTVETHIYKAVQELEKEITEYLGYSPKKRQMKRMIMLAL